LRAPAQDGAVLAQPPLADVGRLLADNRRALAQPSATLLGRPWEELRRQARQAAVVAARDYLRRAGEPVPDGGDLPLLLAGHQPELFHPGVWVKNFALNGLARQHGLLPLNLLVDNDTAKTTLHVPALHDGPASVRRTALAFDRWKDEVPYEERPVLDEALFADLPQRVAAALPRPGFTPLLPAFWAEARRQGQRTHLLGERLAAARRTFERRWGCFNLELPVSLLCQTEPFAWFACHLLTHLPRLHSVYNATVRAYRREHGIRSRHHPVPDLAAEGDWLEVPLWAWHAGQQRRGRLLARQTRTAIELRVGKEAWPSLPLGDGPALVAAWQELEHRGCKVRSRALANTLFARLFLGDLFMHGIGGGKYDELTDALMRRFYEVEPPQYLVLSATLLLPLPTLPARPDDCRKLAHDLRDVQWNPQRHLPAAVAPEARAWAEQKQAWIARPGVTRRERRERYRALRSLTDNLRALLAEREVELRRQLAQCDEQVQANAALRRRDYAFCLYPESLLRPFCTQFL
jgi:hypothetical protein